MVKQIMDPHGRKLIQSHEKTNKNQGRNALVPCSWKEIINHFLGCHGTCQVVCRTIMYYNSRISSKLTVQHPAEVLTGFNGMDQDLECWERFAGKNARNRLPAEYVDTIDTTGGLYLGVVLYPLYTNMFCLHYVVVLLTAVVENTFCLNLDFKRPRFLLGEKCIYTNIYTYIHPRQRTFPGYCTIWSRSGGVCLHSSFPSMTIMTCFFDASTKKGLGSEMRIY